MTRILVDLQFQSKHFNTLRTFLRKANQISVNNDKSKEGLSPQFQKAISFRINNEKEPSSKTFIFFPKASNFVLAWKK